MRLDIMLELIPLLNGGESSGSHPVKEVVEIAFSQSAEEETAEFTGANWGRAAPTC